MDLRTRTTLLCAAFAIAITVSILLRARKSRAHYLLSAFAGTMALWYSAQWLSRFFQAVIWYRFTAVLAVLLPQFALHLFEAIVPHPRGERALLLRVATAVGVPMLVLAFSNYQQMGIVRGAIFLYVFGLVAAGLASLAARGRRSSSRAVRERVRLLVLVGASALAFSIGDFIWFIGAEIPPVGAVLSVVFLFALAESMQRERLIDLYEMVGRLVVSTALAFCLAGIFYVFVTWVGFETMYLNAVLAAIAILVLFEPLRAGVEDRIHLILFRQRRELENAARQAEQRLVHILEVDEMGEVVIDTLEASRRATAAALYLLDPDGHDLALRKSFGALFPPRVETATARPLLERLESSASVVLDILVREQSNARATGASTTEVDALLTAVRLLSAAAGSSVIAGIRTTGGDVVGLLVVHDDRVRDAFSVDEVQILERLASLASVVVENSRAYARMKERDRLAVLGQMAAGLAHEIKNPLGSIKGAAQLLVDSGPDAPQLPPGSRDFVEIIIEEVNRLDRVVGSVLDYARPRKGNPAPVDVSAVVRRTVQVMSSSIPEGVQVHLVEQSGLPFVRIDAEQLRQVLLNILQNALQAMGSRGTITITTRTRTQPAAGRPGNGVRREAEWVEIAVRDTGPGIAAPTLKHLFVPFFSTKATGTGLGLAISQRLAQEAGGTIEVASQEGAGSTFTIVLPASGTHADADETAGPSQHAPPLQPARDA
jgi:two-component system sensor histidine kinase HydH